jgi:hypothetical protein
LREVGLRERERERERETEMRANGSIGNLSRLNLTFGHGSPS